VHWLTLYRGWGEALARLAIVGWEAEQEADENLNHKQVAISEPKRLSFDSSWIAEVPNSSTPAPTNVPCGAASVAASRKAMTRGAALGYPVGKLTAR
jgi:hypothetical protein